MEQQEKDKVVGDLFTATRDFLGHAMRKSGMRGDLEKMSSLVSFTLNDNKMRSMFLGEYVSPSEKDPDGEIRLHIDAIIDYASYLGVDYWSMLAKVLFCQIHHALTWESKEKFDFEKAEKFSSKICKKLLKQQIITDMRPKMYIAANDRLTLAARQKWIEKWLGMGYEEAFAEAIKAREATPEEVSKQCQNCFEEPAAEGSTLCKGCQDKPDDTPMEELIDKIE